MRNWIKAALITASLLVGGMCFSPSAAAPPPEQRNPDIFPIDVRYVPADADGDGDRDMQDINPTNVKAKRDRSINYRLITMSGCIAGDIPEWLSGSVTDELAGVQFSLIRNDQTYDFTIFISCGLTHVGKCGSVGVFCLADGFPYNTNIYLSDVLRSYTPESKKSIPLHELLHAIATWNEQYQSCTGCNFAPTPNLVDFMNTGPLSRVGFTENTIRRWEETMYTLECSLSPPNIYGHRWDECNQIWWAPDGNFYYYSDQWAVWLWNWFPCNGDGLRWETYDNEWDRPGSQDYDEARGKFWEVVPAC